MGLRRAAARDGLAGEHDGIRLNDLAAEVLTLAEAGLAAGAIGELAPGDYLTLTVTEGGYNVSRTDGSFDLTAPGVAADLAPGAAPRTVFGVVTAALAVAVGLAVGTVMQPGTGNLSLSVVRLQRR